MDDDIKFNSEGVIFDCWWDEEVGVCSRHSNHCGEDTLFGNIAFSGDEGR